MNISTAERNRSRPWLAILCVSLCLLGGGCTHRMLSPKPYVAFVAAKAGQCLSVVDLGDFKLLRIVPLGFSPTGVYVRGHSRELYITSTAGEISVVRYPSLTLVAKFRIATGPSTFCVSPDGRNAYALAPGRRGVLVLAGDPPGITAQHALKRSIARLALGPDPKTLLAEDTDRHELLFLNAVSGDVLESVPLGPDPGPMIVMPGTRKVFIADTHQQAVSAADLRTGQVLSQIEIGSTPALLAPKPDGGELFAISATSSTLTILDASSDSVEQSLPTGAEPAAAIFSADSRFLYIANAGDGSVTTLDVRNRNVVASTRIGIRPVALALTPDQRFLAVADADAASIAVMRARAPALITTIPVGGDPVAVSIPGWLWNSRQ